MDVTTATPAAIDDRIARAESAIASAQNTRDNGLDLLDRIAKVQGTYEADYPWFSYEKQEQASGAVRAAEATIARLTAEVAPLHAEFTRRGGWTRFYLVTNTGGHVHFTTACASCFPTTKFAWLTDYSGMTHDALVAEARSSACTVCFPDAPVDNRKSTIRYESDEVRARREEREAKAAAKAAAEVTVDGWIEYRGPQTRVFKTERALTNAIAGELSSLCCWGTTHPSSQEWISNVAVGRAALAARGVDYDYDKALTAARKRTVREGGRAAY